jgi:hypothetical protein
MKYAFSIATLAVLAACSASPTSSPLPGGAALTPSVASGRPVGEFSATAGAPNRGVAPDAAKSVKIKSLLLDGTVNGKTEDGYVPATCTAKDDNGVATGCGLKASETLKISNLTAELLTGPQGTGCVAGIGKYSGTVKSGQIVPIKFKWTGKC